MLFFGLREDDWCSSTLDLGMCSVMFPTPVECEECFVDCSCVVCVFLYAIVGNAVLFSTPVV